MTSWTRRAAAGNAIGGASRFHIMTLVDSVLGEVGGAGCGRTPMQAVTVAHSARPTTDVRIWNTIISLLKDHQRLHPGGAGMRGEPVAAGVAQRDGGR